MTDFDVTMSEPILVDLDNDGILETTVQEFDTNGDGVVDTWEYQIDDDGDGMADRISIALGYDTDGDGQLDTWQVETDHDGDLVADEVVLTTDSDFDGLADTVSQQWNGDSSQVVGDPSSDIDNWHEQTYPDTCAVVSQEFILDELTGQDVTEDQLRQLAIDNGWYTPGGGTPLEATGNLLEAYGIPVEKQYGCTLEDLNDKLSQGEKIIVGLDSGEIFNPATDEENLLNEYVGMPGQDANHAVQVIGIDYSDPNNPMVILNDPGHGAGQGLMVPADQFLDAWEDSNNFMVSTARNSA
jgi:hypothetical protein